MLPRKIGPPRPLWCGTGWCSVGEEKRKGGGNVIQEVPKTGDEENEIKKNYQVY
jgi:hypothetical protein